MAILNWVEIGGGRLALTNRPKLVDIPNFFEQGCNRIVTLQGRSELPSQIGRAAKKVDIEWLWIPVGHGTRPEGETDFQMRRGVGEVVGFLRRGESILIHCSAGIHRTGMFALALLRCLGLSESDALVLIESLRPVTREGMRPEFVDWANEVARDLG